MQPVISAQVPEPSFGDFDTINSADIQDFANKDTNRIVGNIVKCLARKTPYTDILTGGTIAAGISDTVRSVVSERAFSNVLLTRPAFTTDTEMCGEVGEDIEVGSKEYTHSLATLRGRGPLICVKGMRNAFMGAYVAAENSMQKTTVQIMNADVRATLTDRSGCKLVVHTGKTFEQMFAGDSQEIDTAFTTDVGLPDAPLSFSLLKRSANFLREDLLVDGFEGTAAEPLFKFIGSAEIIDVLRDEAGIRDDQRYIAAGSFGSGKDALTKYTWEGPYRGFAFGVDSQPLRFSVLNGSGQPVFIEPEISKNTTKGKASRVNPAWARARFEIALVIGADSFKRLTPTQYNGEGTFKFPAQVSTGEMRFKVIEDNGENVWGDYGRHYYQIQRAYQPIRPHAVMAIAFKRPDSSSFGLTSVSDYTNYSSTDSL